MTRHLLVLGFAVMIQTLGAAEATAQAPPPPVVSQPAPQPMRFILRNGTVIIGTEVGGDAAWVFVQTDNGVLQVSRADIASMDYQVGQVGVAVVAPAPQASFVFGSPRPRRRGRGLVIAGSIVFGIGYGIPAMIGVAAGLESSSAMWLVVPIAGPLLWAATTCEEDEWERTCKSLAYTFGGLFTIMQATGATLLITGLSLRSGSSDQAAHGSRAASARLRLELSPLVGPGYKGLGLMGEF